MNLNELKDKVLGGIGKAADTGKDLVNKGTDKAKDVARIAKLKTEIATENENMRKAYLEIGKLYYDTHKDDPEGFFIQLCDEIGLAQKNIADKESEIETLKSKGEEALDDLGEELDEVVSQEEAKVADIVDAVQEKAEEVKAAAEEKAEEVKAAVEEKAEEIKETAEEKIDEVKEAAEEAKEAAEEKIEEIKDKIDE